MHKPSSPDKLRRQLLKGSLGLMALSLSRSVFADFHQQSERHLACFHLHTEESLSVCYWRDGVYLTEALAEIDFLLRDHRTGEQQPIDRNLLDMIALLYDMVSGKGPYHIISGFRSAQTNAQLRANSTGVAQKSFHMRGRAIDLRLPGVPLKTLHQQAIALEAGGVGFYPKSDFIHLDTGTVRHWQG